MHGFGHGMKDSEAALVRADFVGCTEAIQVIVEESICSLNELLKGRTAGRFDETIWIMGSRERRHADGEARGKEAIQGAHSGVLAGFIGIEAKNYFVHVAF